MLIAQHLLTTRGMEKPHLPPSTTGPDPMDTTSHLTRKTPLPKHPKPLIQFASDPDSADKKSEPTPKMPPPPQEVERKDFNIKPDDYKTDTVRCVKTAGMKAPGKLLHSKQGLFVSIPYPIDPCKGNPPASKTSIGDIRFHQDDIQPATSSELLDIVQEMPYRWITQETEKVVISDDTPGSSKPDVGNNPPEGAKSGIVDPAVSSETVEEITVYENPEENKEKERKQKEKLKSLKRRLIPSRKSPRLNIPKLDISKGFKSSLQSKERSAVEQIAKSALKNVISETSKPLVGSKGRQASSSVSSSSSSQGSGSFCSKAEEHPGDVCSGSPGWSDNAATEAAEAAGVCKSGFCSRFCSATSFSSADNAVSASASPSSSTGSNNAASCCCSCSSDTAS